MVRLSTSKPVRQPRYNKTEDELLLVDVKALCDERPTYGYRRITALLNRKRAQERRPSLNHKRIYRVMSQHQLLLQRHTGKPTRTHEGQVVTLRSDLRWCSDTFNIRCFNGEKVEVAFSLDTCDREIISYVATSAATTGESIRDLMMQSIEMRFGEIGRAHV